MLRDPSLIPLSRQHHSALALCVRLERALREPGSADLESWQAEVERGFADEIRYHFAAEEERLFPAVRKLPGLEPLVEELLAEHVTLRNYFEKAQARKLSADELGEFGRALTRHVRKEEEQLFQQVQARMQPETMAQLGAEINSYLRNCGMPASACALAFNEKAPPASS